MVVVVVVVVVIHAGFRALGLLFEVLGMTRSRERFSVSDSSFLMQGDII